MRKYAQGTSVSIDRSMAEIRKAITKHAALERFAQLQEGNRVGLQFGIGGRLVRFTMILPEDGDDKETRRMWRCLVLCIKSKLESVASGIVTFDEEFMAQLVTPNGRTFGEVALPQYTKAIESGKPLPPLLGM